MIDNKDKIFYMKKLIRVGLIIGVIFAVIEMIACSTVLFISLFGKSITSMIVDIIAETGLETLTKLISSFGSYIIAILAIAMVPLIIVNIISVIVSAVLIKDLGKSCHKKDVLGKAIGMIVVFFFTGNVPLLISCFLLVLLNDDELEETEAVIIK